MIRRRTLYHLLAVLPLLALIIHWQIVWPRVRAFGAPLVVIPIAVLVHILIPVGVLALVWLKNRYGNQK